MNVSRMLTCRLRLAALALVAALSATTVAQGFESAFTYQGRLQESGEPYDGTVDLTFRLYDALDGGAQIGSELTILNVTVQDGVFTLELDFGDGAFGSDPRWLEIEVGETLLTPRQRITPAPVAQYALSGNEGPQGPAGPQGEPGEPGDSHWSIDGTTTYYNDGSVGIGTSNPNARVEIEGDGSQTLLRLTNGGGDNTALIIGSLVGTGRAVSSYGTTFEPLFTSQNDGSGTVARFLGDVEFTNGYVGIGTADPEHRLHVLMSSSDNAIQGENSGAGAGVLGYNTQTTGIRSGVFGRSDSTGGRGVFGWGTSSTGNNSGVQGQSDSAGGGRGVYGYASATFGTNYGVYGQSNSSSGFDFYAAGAGTNYGASSSIRWKTNIRNIDQPLAKVAQMRGVYYNWDAAHGGQHDVGMIAEEVGEVMPEVVQYEANGVDAIGMDYSKLSPLLVEAINALRAEKDAEIEALHQRIDQLESHLEDVINAMEVR